MRLKGTTESLELVTSSTAPLDVTIDWTESTVTAGDLVNAATDSSTLAITTATTTTILAAGGAAGIRREVTKLHIRNKHASTANTITLQKDVGGTNFEIIEITIGADQTLQYSREDGWRIIGANARS